MISGGARVSNPLALGDPFSEGYGPSNLNERLHPNVWIIYLEKSDFLHSPRLYFNAKTFRNDDV